ncbi:hypothetical protein EDC01DRAFT_611724 [Geopyxis carbonaria]|nr:hypothetical protein EDC01DRAFT_611724 [Geopyxis carbonaria]
MESKKHDELVLQYLDTIDTYQLQMKQLSSELSAGYLALAQANFHSTGIRYGQDFYDERMTAIKRMELKPVDGHIEFILKPRETADGASQKVQKGQLKEEEKKEVDEEEVEETPQVDVQDPIRWFGILVPQSLRTSQSRFSTGVDCVFQLSTTISKLESLSTQMSYLRNTDHLYKILISAPPIPLPASLPLSPLDTQSGYIHLCTGTQVAGVVGRFMNDFKELWVLRIPYERVVNGIKWERVDERDEAGERFPHLFADLGRSEVDAWAALQKSDKGWGAVFSTADWKKLDPGSAVEGSNID